MRIDGRIIDIGPDTVTVDCLLDRASDSFQERIFDRSRFEGVVPLERGRYVVIRMRRGSGAVALEVQDGHGRVDPEPFESDEDLDQLDASTYRAPYNPSDE